MFSLNTLEFVSLLCKKPYEMTNEKVWLFTPFDLKQVKFGRCFNSNEG